MDPDFDPGHSRRARRCGTCVCRHPHDAERLLLCSFDCVVAATCDLDLTGTGTPNPVAPGSGVTLTGSVRPRAAARMGRRVRREPRDPQARARTRSRRRCGSRSPATARRRASRCFSSRRSRGRPSRRTPTATYTVTPIDVTIPLPDTAWTAGTIGAAGYRQAGAGHAAAASPAGPGGSDGHAAGQRLHPADARGRRVDASSTASPALAAMGSRPFTLDCGAVRDRPVRAPARRGHAAREPGARGLAAHDGAEAHGHAR